MRLKKITVGAMLCAALFVAAPAYAQTAAQNGYSHPAGSVEQELGGNGSEAHAKVQQTANTKNESGKLPFTGLDVALVVAAGGVLLAMGFGIRRISRTEVA
jgi:hypothetical protein